MSRDNYDAEITEFAGWFVWAAADQARKRAFGDVIYRSIKNAPQGQPKPWELYEVLRTGAASLYQQLWGHQLAGDEFYLQNIRDNYAMAKLSQDLLRQFDEAAWVNAAMHLASTPLSYHTPTVISEIRELLTTSLAPVMKDLPPPTSTFASPNGIGLTWSCQPTKVVPTVSALVLPRSDYKFRLIKQRGKHAQRANPEEVAWEVRAMFDDGEKC